MNNIIIFGSKGQLGTALCNLFYHKGIEYIGYDYPQIKLEEVRTYKELIEENKPQYLINCAAYTDVYKAETEIVKAMQINGTSLSHIVSICNRRGIHLIHISTDYVFSGNKIDPYLETDLPDPVNIYGLTKYVGERIIQLNSNNFTIIRTSTLYGDSKINSSNIVKKLITFAKKNKLIKLVNDEFVSPTNSNDIAKQIKIIIDNNINGIVHASSEDQCNWVEFGEKLFNLLDIDTKIKEVSSSYFNKNLKKPANSVMRNNVLIEKNLNIMPKWQKSLENYIQDGIFQKLKKY